MLSVNCCKGFLMKIDQKIQNLNEITRKDFPFFANNPDTVYLDSAATSLTPTSVIEAIDRYYQNYSVNVHRGVYRASMEASEVYEGVRDKIRNFISASNDYEVVYTRNTTESINLLAYSLERAHKLGEMYSAWDVPWEKGDVILISESEHHSNIVPWQMLADKVEAQIVFVPVIENGALDLNKFEDIQKELKNRRVKIVSLAHVSNVSGIVHDLKPFSKYARDKGALFIIDGAQSVCHMKVDITDIDCDFYAFSAHKMLGPTGVGTLVGRRDLLDHIPPFLGGGDMILDVLKSKTVYNAPPYKFEAGTPNVSGVFGFGAAIDYLEKVGLDNIHRWEKHLLKYAMESLEKEDGVTMHGPSLTDVKNGAYEKTAVLSFNIDGIHPHDVGTILDEHSVCIRAGHHCCQVLMSVWGTHATNRASFYLYNDFEDVDKLILAIQAVRKIFQKK